MTTHVLAPGAQAQLDERKSLTASAIFGKDGLSEEYTQCFVWRPDGRELSYMRPGPTKAGVRLEIVGVATDTDAQRVVVSSDILADIESSATDGSDSIAKIRFQWAPNSKAILLASDGQLVWFDVATQRTRKLVSRTRGITDPQVSPDSRWVSFVSGYNVWAADVATGKTRQLTRGGSEVLRKGQLD